MAERGCGTSTPLVHIAGIVAESVVDGPGFRYVVFAQGCTFACEGCQNPSAQEVGAGTVMTVDEVVDGIRQSKLTTGVTFSGGEPFLQASAFAAIGRAVKAMGKDLVIFTGYTWEELQELSATCPDVAELVAMSRLIIDGRFEIDKRDLSLPFRGSRNQRIIDVARTMSSGSVVEWTAD